MSDNFGGAVLASPAAGDLDRDGSPEIVVADLEGKVYAWDSGGHRVFSRESKIEYSGKPLTPFVNVRKGVRHRTQHGFLGSPVLGDLDGDKRPEIVAAAMDRHLYAWKADGSLLDGFPVLVVDPTRSPASTPRPTPSPSPTWATPATGCDRRHARHREHRGRATEDSPPEILIGTNEEYREAGSTRAAAMRPRVPSTAARSTPAAIAALQLGGDRRPRPGQRQLPRSTPCTPTARPTPADRSWRAGRSSSGS